MGNRWTDPLHANDCPEDNPKTVSAKYVETEEAKLADDGCRDSNWLRTTGRIRTAQKLAGSSFQCSTALSHHHLYRGRAVYLTSELNKVWHHYGNPTPSH